MRPSAASVRGLKLLVYEALSYYCMRLRQVALRVARCAFGEAVAARSGGGASLQTCARTGCVWQVSAALSVLVLPL
jgi:hypothetical protein